MLNQGAISYSSYDANGNLLTSTDARGITTTNTYDSLNRLLTKTYGDGTPTVTYTYDTVRLGTLSSVSNSVSATSYTAYDALSRVTGSSQTTTGQSNPFPFTYTYNWQGALSSEVRPSGRTVTYSFDAAGRVSSVNGMLGTTPTAYASSVTYASNGGLATMTFGNGVVETTSYSGNRQQAIGVTAVKTGTTLLALGYSHCSTYSEPCTNNNGNVWQQTMARPAGSWTQDYGYTDGLNRLNSVAETGPGTGWSEKYGYDAFGNRWVNPTTEQTLTAETPTGASWYLSNNRISGWGYDSAGNITSVSSMQRTFTYDAENRQTSATINSASATYGYDGQGQRVTKTAGGATTVYVYDAQGDLVEELGGANSDAGTLYLTVDTLGSTRLVTDGNGAQHLCYDYLPFGQEIPAGTDGRPGNCFTTDTLDTKFTSKERDAETGLDFFGARYFSSAQGRFTSPDIPLADQHPEDPQSWNLYSYVRNNPLSYGDPSGRECVKLDGGRVGDDGQGNACQDKSLQTTSGVTVNGTTGAATFSAFGNAVNMGDIDPSGGRDRIYGQTADIVSNITNAKAMLGIAKVGLTVGSLALAMAKLKPAEQAILEELIAAGRTVEVIPTAGGRTADFLVNGVPTELKTLTAAGPTTLKNAVQSAAKQGEQILIDARNVNLTPQEALSQIQRAQGNVGGLQGRVTVLTKSGTVTF